ncbi:MAG TPA: GNAT family N-acetyltransferase [Methylomirabilota bacterium]|jgi:RimJ/RimL family protein N-acetyltransferase|nr:GNAT family N-acetyltransferase [Methylomirabilota bacterium]
MLETERLWLRRLRPSDEPELIRLDSDADVMRYVGSPPGIRPHEETVDRARQRIRADHGPHGWWLVQGKHDRAFHGLALLLPMPDGDDIELGYRLARASWGQGIATEAASALVEYAFGALVLPRLVAVLYPQNRASRRVLDKLSFVEDGLCEYKGARLHRFLLTADTWLARDRGQRRRG